MLKSGFTLIEIIIAIAVSAVIFPAVIILLSLSTYTTSQGETYTKAYALAQSEMENIYASKKTDWNSVPVGGPVCSFVSPFTKCTTVTQINPSEKKVVINISWDERGVTQDITIESLIADI